MYSLIDKPGITLVYHPICKVDELPDGERLFIEIAHEPIVIFNLAGKVFAIGDVCSHDGGPVGDGEIVDHKIICPRHGAKFDIFTGKAVGLPAVEDIPAYPIRINAGQIEIGVPG
jgi:3-phenylpropionate/trans-cinnamate dioxygenase ferredoxin component